MAAKMNIIEQATRRLEELRRGGVDVPWEASRLPEEQFNEMLQSVKQTDARNADRTQPAPASRPQPAPVAVPVPARPVEAARPFDTARARSSRTVELDLARLEREGYLVPGQVRSDLAAQFRHLKRPILKTANEPQNGARRSLIMVTSALPAEGKTFCAVNLAMSIAMEIDTSVLLVDADVVRPSVFERLALNAPRGLLDLLADPALDMADVMLRTNVPKLSLLAAGRPNAMSTELLASDAMDRWLAEIAERYSDRVVVFDAPPLLVTTEARVLASRVGQVLMVVDSTKTSTGKVTEAFGMIENCPLVMSVLNKSTDADTGAGYGYAYGY